MCHSRFQIMNFLRNIKIRTALVLILIFFSLLWAGASGFALYSLKELKLELSVTNIQQNNGDIINGANAQYYRAITSLERAMSSLDKNNSAIYDLEMNATAIELDSLKKGMEQYKSINQENKKKKKIKNI